MFYQQQLFQLEFSEKLSKELEEKRLGYDPKGEKKNLKKIMEEMIRANGKYIYELFSVFTQCPSSGRRPHRGRASPA